MKPLLGVLNIMCSRKCRRDRSRGGEVKDEEDETKVAVVDEVGIF